MAIREKLTMEREQMYMSLETGEVVDTHKEAVALYNLGERIQILYRYRFNEEPWGDWRHGPIWTH